MIDLIVIVAVIAATWYGLGRVEARLLRTGARHPTSPPAAAPDGAGPRLLPVPEPDQRTRRAA